MLKIVKDYDVFTFLRLIWYKTSSGTTSEVRIDPINNDFQDLQLTGTIAVIF